MGIATDVPRATPHTRYNPRVRASLLLVIGSLSFALACGDDHPVPFGLDRPRPEPTTAAPTTAVTTSPGATEWPDGAEVRVADALLSIPDAQVRATFATDLDGDGDDDVLFVANGVDGAVSLGIATRGETGLTFALPIPIAAVCAPAAITSMRLIPLSTGLVAARIERACNGAHEQRLTIARTTPTLRVLDTLVLAPNDGESLGVRGEDRDDDGHEDVVVHVTLHDGSGESADVDLAWLDRAAGLSRDTAEPEATIAARANEARTALRRHPDRALAATRTAVLVHDALCGSTARLAIDDDVGLSCPPSSGLGRALATAAAAEARSGHLTEALAAVVALGRADATVRDADRMLARDALAAMPGVLHPATNDGPEARVVSSADTVRLSSLAFLDEDRVLIRGDTPRVATLSTGTSAPTIENGAVGIDDATHAHTIAEIERACAGTSLVVRPVFGPLDSPSDARSLALIEARTPPAGAVCTDLATDQGLSILQRHDANGWRVLGWAPQGALVARGSTLVMAPLDVNGASVGAGATLADDEPAPAPIASGCATADASAWAFVSSVGIALYRRGQPAALVVPAGFDHADGIAVDVAVSPSATRLAWIASGRLRWVDLSAPPPPPPSTEVPAEAPPH